MYPGRDVPTAASYETLSAQDESFLSIEGPALHLHLGVTLWVDDERFDLDYHVRHVRLPTPGGDDMLKALCARIMSRPLDRARPLWEPVGEGSPRRRLTRLCAQTAHLRGTQSARGLEIVSASFDELLGLARDDARLRGTSHVEEPISVKHGRATFAGIAPLGIKTAPRAFVL